MQECGLLSDDHARRIIENTIATMTEMNGLAPHPSFDLAVGTLTKHLEEWPLRKKRKKP